MEFPRQEHWSGLPFPPPGDFPDRGIKPTPLAMAGEPLSLYQSDFVLPTLAFQKHTHTQMSSFKNAD